MHCKSRWPREIVRDLELPSIGWLLFLPDSSPNDWIASCPTVVTFATRLLTEPLTHLLPQPQCDGYSRQPPPHHDHRDGGGHADRLAQRVPALPDLLGLARIPPALRVPLFNEARGKRILRTSPIRSSRKFILQEGEEGSQGLVPGAFL